MQRTVEGYWIFHHTRAHLKRWNVPIGAPISEPVTVRERLALEYKRRVYYNNKSSSI